jgi:transcriptional regulator with XRE-family HTH domain
MNGFKIKKIQSSTLGEKMRKIRNEKRVGLPEIAKNTKIQMEYLEYLENGDYNKLPADVYVRGFLKSFADYLGVNEEYLIKSFNKEKSIQENIEGSNKEKKINKKINIARFSITPKIISMFFVSLFFLALSFYLYKNLNNFVSNPQLIILNPTTDSVINDTKVVVKGKTDAGNNLFINNQTVLVDDNGDFSENIVLREGKNVIIVKSVNQFNKVATESISVEAHYNIETPKVEESQSPPEEQKMDNGDTGVIVEPTPANGAVLGVDTTTVTDVEKKKKK